MNIVVKYIDDIEHIVSDFNEIDNEKVTYIDCRKNNITELPNMCYPNIKIFLGNTNNIEQLPQIIDCPNLIKLDLCRNKLKFLPNNLYLPKLERLCIQDNYIEELPKNINEMFPQLTSLNLINNNIKELPQNITLPNLKYIYYRDNKFSKIPQSWNCPLIVTDLEELILQDMKLQEKINLNVDKVFKLKETIRVDTFNHLQKVDEFHEKLSYSQEKLEQHHNELSLYNQNKIKLEQKINELSLENINFQNKLNSVRQKELKLEDEINNNLEVIKIKQKAKCSYLNNIIDDTKYNLLLEALELMSEEELLSVSTKSDKNKILPGDNSKRKLKYTALYNYHRTIANWWDYSFDQGKFSTITFNRLNENDESFIQFCSLTSDVFALYQNIN